MNTLAMRKVAGPEQVQKPGNFCIINHSTNHDKAWLYVCLPATPRAMIYECRLFKTSQPTQTPLTAETWNWDGDDNLPSLHPSIELAGRFHGTITRGILTSGLGG